MDIMNTLGDKVTRKTVADTLWEFYNDKEKALEYLLEDIAKREEKKKNNPVNIAKKPKKPKKKPPKKQNKEEKSFKTDLIVARKASRKLSKEEIVDKPLDKRKWNELYPIIDYSLWVKQYN